MIRRIRAGGYAGLILIAYGCYGKGTRILDINDPTNPIQVGYFGPNGGNVWASYWRGDYIVVADTPAASTSLRFNAAGEKASKDRKEVVAPKGRLGSGLLKRRSLGIATAVVLSVAPSGASAATHSIGSGAWSYFGDPRAVHAGGRTFVLGRPEGLHARRRARSQPPDRAPAPDPAVDDRRSQQPVALRAHRRADHGLLFGPQRPAIYTGSPPSRTRSRASRRRTGSATNTPGRWATRTRTRSGPTAGCGCCSGAPTGSRATRSAGLRWSRAQTLVRGPLFTRAPRRAPRPRRAPPTLRQVRERRRAHPRDVHRGQPRGLPELDLVRLVRPHRRSTALPAAASRDSAPRRRSGGRDLRPREFRLPTVGARHRRQPVRTESIVYMRRTLRPGTGGPGTTADAGATTASPVRRSTPRSPGAVGGATLDREDPSIVYLSRLTPDRPGHDVEVRADAGRRPLVEADDDHPFPDRRSAAGQASRAHALQPGALGFRAADRLDVVRHAHPHRIASPSSARAMTSRWISLVPS